MRIAIVLILLAAAVPAAAQEPAPATHASVYKVDFLIRDGSEAAGAGRRYSMLIELGGKGTFRVGTKVAYATGTTLSGSAPATTQFNFADVGVSIDARLRPSGDRCGLSADVDVTNVMKSATAAASALPPTFGQIHISIGAVLSAGKPTLVASIDDPVTARRFDVEATVSPVPR